MTKNTHTNSKSIENEGCSAAPAVDIYESPNEYMMKFEIPGVTRQDLAITLENNELEIRGTVDGSSLNDYRHIYSEYALDNYYRKFAVGDDIDADKVEAKLENGVLTLTLHKREERKPRKIEILTH